MSKKVDNETDEIELLSVDDSNDEIEEKPIKKRKTVKKIDNDRISIDEDTPVVKEKSKYKWIIIILIILILVLIIIIGKTINDNKDITKGKDYSSEKVRSSKKKQDVHRVTCTNKKNQFYGYDYYFELEYLDNNLSKYSYNFIVDKGHEMYEEEVWNYVEYYKDKMKFEPDVSGYSLDDPSNPYKYHIYYELSAENYCKEIGSCDEKNLRFDLVDEIVPDFEKSLGVTCEVK